MEGIPEEVLFDIEMQSYAEYNDKIATMYDYLGEFYSYKDIEDMERQEREYEKQLKQDYLDGKLIYTEEDFENIRKAWGNR